MSALHRKIEGILGCLSDKKTPDEIARRRQPPEKDEDLFITGLNHDYAVDAYQKIAPSKAFRRLIFKTQVLTAANNAHIRNRATHTFEVVNVATIIARILGLNENLCCAIALGHDIGHAPFGHIGERFISQVTDKEFRHEIFGVNIVQHIERKGKGLNLTHQVLEGILNHSRGSNDLTRNANISEEANVVMYADKIAYIFADIRDIFERKGGLEFDKFPQLKKLVESCGKTHREQVALCVENLCFESAEKGYVAFEESDAAKIFSEIKENMYKIYRLVNIFNGTEILEKAYVFLSKIGIIGDIDPAIVLALMTDSGVLYLYKKDYVNANDFYRCSVAEIIEHLQGKNINFLEPDLDW